MRCHHSGREGLAKGVKGGRTAHKQISHSKSLLFIEGLLAVTEGILMAFGSINSWFCATGRRGYEATPTCRLLVYLVGWMGGWALSVLFPRLGVGPLVSSWEANAVKKRERKVMNFALASPECNAEISTCSWVPPQLGSGVWSWMMAARSKESGKILVSVLG